MYYYYTKCVQHLLNIYCLSIHLKTKGDNFISAFQNVMVLFGNDDRIKHSNDSSILVMLYYW